MSTTASRTIRSPCPCWPTASPSTAGRDISVTGNRVSDSLWQGGGIQIANRFHATPLDGAITLEGNVINRAGAREVNWNIDIGALWVFADDTPINAKISVSDTDIRDSTFAGRPGIGGKR